MTGRNFYERLQTQLEKDFATESTFKQVISIDVPASSAHNERDNSQSRKMSPEQVSQLSICQHFLTITNYVAIKGFCCFTILHKLDRYFLQQ